MGFEPFGGDDYATVKTRFVLLKLSRSLIIAPIPSALSSAVL